MSEIICPNKDEMDSLMYLNTTLLRLGAYKSGLYVGQPLILNIISDNPGLTQKMIADIAKIKPSTINVMLARMEKNGLVKSKKDKENSKICRVFITEKGEKLGNNALNFKNNIRKRQFDGLTEQEIQDFKNILKKINKNLERLLHEEETLNEDK